jgi:hydroxypyruvate isomerase
MHRRVISIKASVDLQQSPPEKVIFVLLFSKLSNMLGGYGQVAGVPDRNEPDCGEVYFPHLFRLVDQLDYQGWIGCEYQPATTIEEGLGWLKQFLQAESSA